MAVWWCGPSACVCVCVSSRSTLNLFFFQILLMGFSSGNVKTLRHTLLTIYYSYHFFKSPIQTTVASVLNFSDCGSRGGVSGFVRADQCDVCVRACEQTLGKRLEGLELQLCGLHQQKKRWEKCNLYNSWKSPQHPPKVIALHTCAECTAMQQVTAKHLIYCLFQLLQCQSLVLAKRNEPFNLIWPFSLLEELAACIRYAIPAGAFSKAKAGVFARLIVLHLNVSLGRTSKCMNCNAQNKQQQSKTRSLSQVDWSGGWNASASVHWRQVAQPAAGVSFTWLTVFQTVQTRCVHMQH